MKGLERRSEEEGRERVVDGCGALRVGPPETLVPEEPEAPEEEAPGVDEDKGEPERDWAGVCLALTPALVEDSADT